MTAPASCPETGDVQVWYARPREVWPSPDAAARARDWLQPAERARHDRYRRDADRAMFLLGRVMARALVGRALGVAPTAWPWRDGTRGRPEIDLAACGLSFNLAHSGGVVVCAIGRGVEVGVDVEHRARAALDRRMVPRYCSPAEQADIAACGDTGWQDRFLKFWTLKEAYLKARGLGLVVPLAELSFDLSAPQIRLEFLGSLAGTDPRWAFALTRIDAEHYVAAAASTAAHPHPRFSLAALPADVLPSWT
jgi:4'-phosphopantetheinyl transferase